MIIKIALTILILDLIIILYCCFTICYVHFTKEKRSAK